MVRRSGRLNPRAEGEVRREAEIPPINPEMDDSTNNDISDEVSEEGDSISDADSEDLSRLTKPQALEYIRENYSKPDSKICYASISGLKEIFPFLSKDDIRKELSKFESWSLMKGTRKGKKYNPFLAQHVRDCWQIDTVHLQELKGYNAGISYLLCVIDVFSKYLWVRPLTNCKARDTKEGLKSILQSVEFFPETIVCDR